MNWKKIILNIIIFVVIASLFIHNDKYLVLPLYFIGEYLTRKVTNSTIGEGPVIILGGFKIPLKDISDLNIKRLFEAIDTSPLHNSEQIDRQIKDIRLLGNEAKRRGLEL